MEIRKDYPIRLTGSRAWRTYFGGKLLEQFHGAKTGEDDHFPEEWIASLVAARNAGREELTEGLSMLADRPSVSFKELIESDPAGYLGEEHAVQLGATLGVLVKLIDSAERLAVQVHPDKEKARELFHSEYGKTECWHILGGREIQGEKPYVYLGFRPGVTPEHWKDCFLRQDIRAILECLHRFEIQEGDTILIEGGVPHAIGAGCFLVEIQEPTDYTIRVERVTPSGYQVADSMCHQGLGFEKMFECFHYETFSEEEARKRWFIPAKVLEEEGKNHRIRLVGYEETPCFCMDMMEIKDVMSLKQNGCSAVYVLEGSGKLLLEERNDVQEATGNEKVWQEEVKQGDQFFLPAGIQELKWKAEDGSCLKLIQCFGPELGLQVGEINGLR